MTNDDMNTTQADNNRTAAHVRVNQHRCYNFVCAACAYALAGVELGYAAVNERGQVYLTGAPPGSVIARAKLCPQNHFCPGGSPFVGGSGVPRPCQNGLRTVGEGATSEDQCGMYWGRLVCSLFRSFFCTVCYLGIYTA